jgi:hypothetical protein
MRRLTRASIRIRPRRLRRDGRLLYVRLAVCPCGWAQLVGGGHWKAVRRADRHWLEDHDQERRYRRRRAA